MAKVLINDTTLTAIGDAIRSKTGSEDTYKPSEMPEAILGIVSGTGMLISTPTDTTRMFAGDGGALAWGNANLISQIKFVEDGCITNGSTEMFVSNRYLESFPIELVFESGNGPIDSFFKGCFALKELPVMRTIDGSKIVLGNNYAVPSGTSYKYMSCKDVFNYCNNLEEIPLADWSWGGGEMSYMFQYCKRVRDLDFTDFISGANDLARVAFNYQYTFRGCVDVDEITGLKFPSYDTGHHLVGATNPFANTFDYCYRLKKLTFEPNQIVNLENESGSSSFTPVIDLTMCVGATEGTTASTSAHYPDFFDERTDKEVSDVATYEALKNDPDWWTRSAQYSRYNHDSAVETINSLPTISVRGGTATIKFQGDYGTYTDGGAISTLTEEEIAVATAKGWTVSLV